MRPHPISLLIAVVWLIMMTLLVRHHVLPHSIGRNAQPLSTEQIGSEWQDQHEHMLIRQSGRNLGASVMHIVRDPETGRHRFSQALQLNMGLGPFAAVIRLSAAAELGTALELERFWARFGTATISTTVRGQTVGSDLVISIESPLGTQVYRQPLEEPISLIDAIRPGIFEHIELTPGASYRIPSADLIGSMAESAGLSSVGDLILEVQDYDLVETELGRIPAYEIATSFGGVVSMVWVDESGRVIRQQIWGDVHMERASHRVLSDLGHTDILAPVEMPEFDLSDLEAQPLDTATAGVDFLSLRRMLSGGIE